MARLEAFTEAARAAPLASGPRVLLLSFDSSVDPSLPLLSAVLAKAVLQ